MTTSTAIAAEVRATLGRQGLTQSELAQRMGHNNTWVSARIGRRANVNITIDEVVEMAEALGVDAERLVLDALRARRDSNPKPSDLEPATARFVNEALTADCGNRSEWVLAA